MPTPDSSVIAPEPTPTPTPTTPPPPASPVPAIVRVEIFHELNGVDAAVLYDHVAVLAGRRLVDLEVDNQRVEAELRRCARAARASKPRLV